MADVGRIAVIGGGVAGLACAYRLREVAAREGRDLELCLFERERAAGGKLRSSREDGYLFEEGPNGFLDNEPATLRLVRDLGLDGELQRSEDAARRRYLLIGGELRELPMSPPAFLKSNILPWPAKLRMGMELLVPRRKGLGLAAEDPARDETVDAFGRRRLGGAFANTLLDPMVKGIFGGDSRRLSLEACFPKMVAMEREHGGLFKAMIRMGRERKRAARAARAANDGSGPAGPGGVLHSFRDGMAALPAALSASLGDSVTSGAGVERVERDGEGWRLYGDGVDAARFDAVIDATPAHAAARHHGDPELSKRLAAIPYAPMAVATMVVDVDALEHAADGFGMLVPSAERRRLLGVLWSASIFAGRAPAGKVILRCMAGGATDPRVMELGDDALVATLLAELREIHGLRAEPERVRVTRHERAIAQYEQGHPALLAALERIVERRPGLCFTGSAYRGVSVNHCIAEAERLAADLSAEWSGDRRMAAGGGA